MWCRISMIVLTVLAACSSGPPRDDVDDPSSDAGATAPDGGMLAPDAGELAPDTGSLIGPVPEYPQREGDAERGYRLLVNEGYVGCGLPYSAFSLQGAAPEHLRLPGREGHNAELAYDSNAFVTQSGVEVVANNCLTCHAALLGDRLIIGLGDANRDWTFDAAQPAELAGFLINDPEERTEWRKWADRMVAIAPYIRPNVIGVNPADNLGLALFAHRDPTSLAWSNEALMEPPPTYVVPVDVPPWWRMKKKNAMFYTGAGRGDHARIMMTASVLCVDSINEAAFIDSYFPDVRAYISSLDPPAYPAAIDDTLAANGRAVFERTCSRCHGTYGEGGVYPNMIVSLEEVGTDELMAVGSVGEATRFREWFHASFYGELSRLEPALGYVSPPLDGIWATAPFLHNGSVPNIEALLDSSKRPTYWTRTFSANDYVPEEMGWRYTVLDRGQDAEPNADRKKRIYDTTMPGYSNRGHTFGDQLTAEERRAVIEYLKTL
jgi:hypothetical protein